MGEVSRAHRYKQLVEAGLLFGFFHFFVGTGLPFPLAVFDVLFPSNDAGVEMTCPQTSDECTQFPSFTISCDNYRCIENCVQIFQIGAGKCSVKFKVRRHHFGSSIHLYEVGHVF